MAKAVKYVALAVGAVALIATGVGALAMPALMGVVSIAGVSTTTMFMVSGALSVVSALMQKPPEIPASQVDRLNATVDPRAFRKTALGSTALATDIRYIEWFGNDQERCGWIVCHASHRIQSVDEIWLDDELAWTSTGGTQGRFANYFWVRRVILEGSPANAFSFGSGEWNGSRRLTGCAYSQLEFKVTGNGKKAESPFASGIPNRVTVIGKGGMLYDPRRDSTVPGGSGPMRADDQSTWRYVTDDGADIGENLALHILRVLLGWKINGKLAVGVGVPKRRINLQSFLIAANQAEERVNRSAGGTEARFRGAGVISEGDDPRTIQDMLCAACCGRFRDDGGQLSLAIMHNDLASAATDAGLNEDDVVGAFTWDPDPSLESTPNIVRGKYTDASTESLYQLVPYPDVSLPSFDGIDRMMTMDLAWIESPSQAQRVVKQVLQRKQYQRRFSAPFDITGWRYKVGDVVPFTFAPLGFTRRLFRIVETSPGANPCNMVLEAEDAAIYAWDNDDRAPVRAAAPIVYDKGNNPLILGINEAATTAMWTGVVDNDPTRPRPADGATVGAPAGTDVAGRPAGQVLLDIDLNADSLLAYTFNGQVLKDYVDGKLYVEGRPVNTVVSTEILERREADNALAQKIDLIGVTNSDGSAFILNMATVMAGEVKTLGERFGGIDMALSDLNLNAVTAAQFNELNAAVEGQLSNIQSLQQVLVVPGQGASALALFRMNVNNHIVGYKMTNDGGTGKIVFTFDSMEIRTPAGTPMFLAENGVVKMPNVEIDRLKVNTAMIPSRASAGNRVTSPSVMTTVLVASINLPVPGWVEAQFFAKLDFPGGDEDWGLQMLINGVGVFAVGGAKTSDSAALGGSQLCSPGTVTVEVQFRAHSSVGIQARTMFAKGFPYSE